MDVPSTTVFKDARKRDYLNQEGADKPLKSPIKPSVVEAAREYRLGRLRDAMAARECAGLLLYDPVNIRYALDVSNMQVWTAHNAVRYALILNEGPAILFEFKGAFHLGDDRPAIDEIRPAIAWIYLSTGDRSAERVEVWADEIADLIVSHGGQNRRLAVDKLEPLGQWALEKREIDLVEGQELTEGARSIKSAEEIQLMRWTIRVCEAGMARVYENSIPGKTEQEIWAELHFENARSGGEWIETRLLTCGARTNPWYSECSDAVCQRGEMIAFDTDMIGPYGYCADLSRSWTCGHVRMTPKQYDLYATAVEQIEHNLALLKPGLSFRDFNERSWKIPPKHRPFRYTLAAHAVGMADEWPVVPLHPDFERAYDGHFEENMVICVESLIAEAGTESVKLETQAVITKTGAERLDTFPWETG
ncbi:MAG: Xaa-Pro peptidase family protein [Pseudomonadota bacterium]